MNDVTPKEDHSALVAKLRTLAAYYSGRSVPAYANGNSPDIVTTLAEAANAIDSLSEGTNLDTARLDYMAKHLHRIAEHYQEGGKVDCHAWAVAAATNDLRGTLDTIMEKAPEGSK